MQQGTWPLPRSPAAYPKMPPPPQWGYRTVPYGTGDGRSVRAVLAFMKRTARHALGRQLFAAAACRPRLSYVSRHGPTTGCTATVSGAHHGRLETTVTEAQMRVCGLQSITMRLTTSTRCAVTSGSGDEVRQPTQVGALISSPVTLRVWADHAPKSSCIMLQTHTVLQ
jgi:hypothetical protein